MSARSLAVGTRSGAAPRHDRAWPGHPRLFTDVTRHRGNRVDIPAFELRRAGLTHSDLRGLLRQNGVWDMSEVQSAIFEERGEPR